MEQKQFMILGLKYFPVKHPTSEKDNPYIYNSFYGAFQAMQVLYSKEYGYDIRKPESQLSIVELRTIIPYGSNPDVPNYVDKDVEEIGDVLNRKWYEFWK